MTGRTHDLAGFTALSIVIATQNVPDISLPTALVAISANFIGALAPDIDQSTGTLWRRVRGGTIFGRLISPLLGGHRYISHSLMGIFIFGFVLDKILSFMNSFLLVDMNVVWWSFIIGFVSHLIMDTLTRDGVPWFFPIPINFGFPPLKFLRMKTGGLLEKSFIFPGLLLTNIYIYYNYYPKFLELLKGLN